MARKIILICGESGSGKTAIAKILEDTLGMSYLPSYTTRPPREKNERGHIFLSEDEFNNIKIEDIVAYTKFNGYEYCATKEQVDKYDVYVIDKEGISSFRKKYDGNKRPIVFYIKTSEEIRKERMLKRGDSMKDVLKRLENDKIAFKNIEYYADFILENNKNTNILELAKKIWFFYCK